MRRGIPGLEGTDTGIKRHDVCRLVFTGNLSLFLVDPDERPLLQQPVICKLAIAAHHTLYIWPVVVCLAVLMVKRRVHFASRMVLPWLSWTLAWWRCLIWGPMSAVSAPFLQSAVFPFVVSTSRPRWVPGQLLVSVELAWVEAQTCLAVLDADHDHLLPLLLRAKPETVSRRLSQPFCLYVSVNDKIPSLDCLLDGLIKDVVRNIFHEGPSPIVNAFSPQAPKMVKTRGRVVSFLFGDVFFHDHVIYKPIMSST
jgi:hypothetical protein